MKDTQIRLEIINNKRALYQSLVSMKKDELTDEEIGIMLLLSKDKDIQRMFNEDGSYKFNLFKKST